MNVPKWLIPAISVVAALALGVAMAFVGANFASKVTKEVASKTEVDPVIAPAASGLSAAQVKTLLASKTPLSSPKIGNQRATLPGAVPSTTPLQREVERIAGGGAPTTPSDGGSASTPTPAPHPTLTAAPVIEHFAPVAPSTNDDPCAPTHGVTPIGCPDGLHSTIFADTAPPPIDIAATPFASPCGTQPVHFGSDASRVNVPILITTNQPGILNITFWDLYHSPYEGPRELTDIPTDRTTSEAWTVADQANTPASGLPDVSTCVTLPNVKAGLEYAYDVDLVTPNQSREGDFWLNTNGVLTEQPLQIETFGSDGFVAYGDYRTSEQIGIRAYAGANAASTTCANATATLHELTPIETQLRDINHYETTRVGEPTDLNHREAEGFIVPAGSSVLVCGRWWNSGSSPSWARTTPLRTSTVTVQAPDEILPIVQVSGTGVYDNPGAATVTATVVTIEGEVCGSAVVYRGQFSNPGHDGVLNCSLAGTGAYGDTRNDYLASVGFSGNLRIAITVRYTDGHSGYYSEILPTSESRPERCVDTDRYDPCGHVEDVYEVGVPYYYLSNGHSPADGELNVVVGWNKVGSTGFSDWLVQPQELEVAPAAADPAAAAPLLNTDGRITAVTTHAPQAVSASYRVTTNTPADYTLSLTGVSGPGCSVAGAPLRVSGHVESGTVATIPGLCFGSTYWASITLTNSHGTTVWGHDHPSAGWNGDLLTTPGRVVSVSVQESVTLPSGGSVQYVDASIGGQELDPDAIRTTCWTRSTQIGTATQMLQLPTSTRVHIEYRQTPAGGACSTNAHEVVNPLLESDLAVNLSTLEANPAGETFTFGPVSVLVKVTAVS